MEILLAMAPPPDGSGGGGGSLISTLIMFGAIFAIFYFMIIRPQQKRAKERDKLLSSVQKGDKVILSSGLYGTIAGLEEKTCLIDVGNNVKMKFDRSAIASVVKE
ncbi:MAG TPA: preprotein translocase subunit YajC [Melioribacteraceae bacterium]|mgnify:CR=1 FL=1|nr:preprotein translocase subunit YajC [Melioribacteraceae bacterium]